MIPFQNNINDEDRIFNLTNVLSYLNSYMTTNVVIIEQHKNLITNCCFEKIKQKTFNNLNIVWENYISEKKCFEKTKLYNIGMKFVSPNIDIIIPYDADVLIPIVQLNTAKLSLEDNIDYCFPFNKNYIEIAKIIKSARNNLLKTYNFNEYIKEAKVYTDKLYSSRVKNGPPGLFRNCPPGGCIFIKRKVYIEMGLENEDFCGYGPEDVERKNRLSKLNYKTTQVEGDIYHIEHTSSNTKITSVENKKLFQMLEKMSAQEIKTYYSIKNYAKKYEIT